MLELAPDKSFVSVSVFEPKVTLPLVNVNVPVTAVDAPSVIPEALLTVILFAAVKAAGNV